MGSDVIEGVHYSHHVNARDGIEVHTSRGALTSKTEPLLATGAEHLQEMGLPIKPVYTSAMHVPLWAEDSAMVSPHPMTFSDRNPNNPYLWGAIDSYGVLTFGAAESENKSNRPALEEGLRKKFHELRPDLADKYANMVSFSFGAMAVTPNGFPIVGRMQGCDVAGGFGDRAIIGSFAAGRTYAEMFLLGDDANLRLWENLNVLSALRNNATLGKPELFSPAAKELR
jgi:glycine/D-amino acid oxidase-like deaminating enzyme